MSEIIKTITANFENIDLAELACKNIKERYPSINAVSIRYKNIPQYNHNHSISTTITDDFLKGDVLADNTAYVGLSASMGSGLNGPITAIGTIFAGDVDYNNNNSFDSSTPEIEKSLESKVIIKASSDVKNISQTLRSLGGQNLVVR